MKIVRHVTSSCMAAKQPQFRVQEVLLAWLMFQV